MDSAKPTSSTDRAVSNLSRDIGPWVLMLYGLGTVVGAGIYVVIGEIIGIAGALAPIAFLLAAIAAAFTALSYAELSTRVPESGGSASFVSAGFGSRTLTGLAGWGIVATGIVSAATIVTGFVGYANVFVSISKWWAVPLLTAILTTFAVTGIRQSSWFMALTTIAGVGGLLWVIFQGWTDLGEYPALFESAWTEDGLSFTAAVIPAAFLAFYAYIGFEDMVTLSEEAKDQENAMPRAIWFTLLASLLLYLVVSATVVSVLSPEALSQSTAPLVDLVRAKGSSGYILGAVSLAMIVNGAMAQIVMAPRVMHDLGKRRDAAPDWLAKVNEKTGTPIIATLLSGAAVTALALFFPTERLASWTSFIILAVFATANLSLMRIKMRDGSDRASYTVPLFVPIAGTVVSVGLIVGEILL
ncbi:amino acid/polyamine/organocation transporter, APC superfamily [Altererythrobacter xiamenensis]|uniref:Amino acid/polyamine/organocation transporter, APC superfamily n=1 Tax=Altererythrobacter xiamenensis TaxID=1316679 RepID=A0A1Y6EM44_9SPHN|nr:APC family permease [Altererythrobacter xiamenensis]SMQ63724.1 amino acid/polyamine/organocation transporter, APC superfamily [Altererythrobacter xiamenensis]